MLLANTKSSSKKIKSTYVESQILDNENIVIIQTKGHCPSKDFKAFFDQLLTQVQVTKSFKWYVNLADFSANPTDIEWFVTQWVPLITQNSGSKHYIAFVVPENIIYQFGIQRRLKRQFPNGCLHLMPIKQEEHALTWLMEADR